MKKILGFAVVMLGWAASALGAVPAVTNVVASQRAGTKLVDIYYDVFDPEGDVMKVTVEVSDTGGATYSVPAFSFSGDYGDDVTNGTGKRIVWNAGVDWDGEYSDRMRVKVIASDARGFPGMLWSYEVPAGGFLMGQDGGPEGNGPSRHVGIPWSYWMSKHEVTAEQYVDFLNTAIAIGDIYRNGLDSVHAVGGSYAGVEEGYLLLNLGMTRDIRWNVNNFEVVAERTGFPVRVTWYGAMAFAQHYGYDLPTEAEWEKAARGPANENEDTHQRYPWGNTIVPGNANYNASGDPYESTLRTSPVGRYNGTQTPAGPDMANPYGLYDLAGNVAEWTRTRWTSTVEDYPLNESLMDDLNTIDGWDVRVIRGGSWNSATNSLACHARTNTTVALDYGAGNGSAAYGALGFRVVRRTIEWTNGLPIATVTENFEDAGGWMDYPFANDSSYRTNVAASGVWRFQYYIYAESAPLRAHSGNRYLGVPSGSTGYLELPPVDNPTQVSLYARLADGASAASISLLQWDGFSWYTHGATKTVSSTAYTKFVFPVTLGSPNNGQLLRVHLRAGTYVDDVNIMTVEE